MSHDFETPNSGPTEALSREQEIIAPKFSVNSEAQTLSQAVYAELRRRIVEREYEAGHRFVERFVADELGVSRVPVREALRELVRDGLVDVRPRRGMVVHQITHEELDELVDIRTALEVLLFRRAMFRLNDETTGRVEDLFNQTRVAIDAGAIEDALRLNRHFHTICVEIANSEIANRMMETIEARIVWMLSQHTDVERVFGQHIEIFSAMRANNEELLNDLVRQHVVDSYESALQMNPEIV